jgi:hypothetical protein
MPELDAYDDYPTLDVTGHHYVVVGYVDRPFVIVNHDHDRSLPERRLHARHSGHHDDDERAGGDDDDDQPDVDDRADHDQAGLDDDIDRGDDDDELGGHDHHCDRGDDDDTPRSHVHDGTHFYGDGCDDDHGRPVHDGDGPSCTPGPAAGRAEPAGPA